MARLGKTPFLSSVFGLMVFLIAFPVWGDVITIEGVIKSVDGKDRSITVTKTTKGKTKDIDLEVDKKAKISLEGKGVDFSSLRPGQKASITFESELAVVTRIEVGESGSSATANQEISERRLEGHTRPVLTVSYSPTGKVFASGGGETIRLWNADGNDAVVSVLSHPMAKNALAKAGVVQLVFSPDGKKLVSGSADGSLRFWDMAIEKPKLLEHTQGSSGLVSALAFSPDGKLLASNERQLGIMRLWDVAENKVINKDISTNSEHEIWSLAFSPDGASLAGGVLVKGKPARGEIWIWDVTKNPVTKRVLLGVDRQPRSVCYSPNGKLIAFSDWGVIRIIDPNSGRQLSVLDCTGGGQNEAVTSVVFSPTGSLLASCGYDGKIRLWDVGSRNLIRTMQGADPGEALEQVAFSPDSRVLISGAKDRSVRIWNIPVENKK